MNDGDFMAEVSAKIDTLGTGSDELISTAVVDKPKEVSTAPSIQEETLDMMTPAEEKPKPRPLLKVKKDEDTIEGADTIEGNVDPNDKAKTKDVKTIDTKDVKSDKDIETKTTKAKGLATILDDYLVADKEGNLFVPNTKSVLAPAGAARDYILRLREEGRKMRDQVERAQPLFYKLVDQHKALQSEYETLKADPKMQDLEKRTGLKRSEVEQGISLMQAYSKDPVSAIKQLLTQAAASGIDLSTIAKTGTVDVATLTNIVKDAVGAPETKQDPLPLTQEQLQKQAEDEANEFMSRNPEASEFLDIIAQAKTAYPERGLDELWLAIRKKLREQLQSQDTQDTKTVLSEDTPKPKEKVITKPVTNYAKMSFDEIAKSVKEDLNV